MAEQRYAAEEAWKRERQQHVRQLDEGKSSRRHQTASQRDMKHQQKILRDHGLVMGHVNNEFLS